MNERIRELAEQAGMTHNKFGMFFALDNHNEDGVDLEKFAELIVRECADLLEIEWGDFNVTGHNAGRAIKEHFGVE